MEDIEYHYIDNETGDVHSSLLLYGNGHVLRLSHGYDYVTKKYHLLDELRFCKPEQGMACLEWQREYLKAMPRGLIEKRISGGQQ